MRQSFFLAAFIFFYFAGYGQFTGTIKGKIIEQSTKQPVTGVSVIIKNSKLGNTTDTSGSFTIAAVPEGSYSLIISFIGFQQKIINDVIITRNKTYYFETELLNDVASLKEVTVKNFRNENNRTMPVSTY